jgi:type IV pilus assembly protein PilW
MTVSCPDLSMSRPGRSMSRSGRSMSRPGHSVLRPGRSESRPGGRARRGQAGLTLVELMVSLLIGLFLVGGLLTLVQDNKRTFTAQNLLAQLQDSERLIVAIMTDVIETAGYFPDPRVNTAASALPAATIAGTVWAAGQAVSGTLGAGATGDTVKVRYATNSGDGVLSCNGSSNASGAVYTYVNTFSVIVQPNGSSDLVCTRDDLAAPGNQFPLVSGVTKLTVLYGVNSAGTGNTVDTYMNAAAVTATGRWANVVSVQLQLAFTNPLYTAAGLGQTATVNFQTDVGIMGVLGI